MNAVVFGKRGMGKTYYCKNHVKKSVLPCVVVDTMNEYGDLAVWLPVSDGMLFEFFKIRVTPKDDDEFNIVMDKLSKLKTPYGINVYIDEIDYWSSVQYIPVELARNLRYSRHYRLNMILTVRNPSEINRKITAMSDVFIIFGITEPRYLDYFKQFDTTLVERIRNLKPHEHITYYLVHHD